MNETVEKRFLDEVVTLQKRAADDGSEKNVIGGVAIKFGSLSKPLITFGDGTFLYEKVSRSAFDDCDMSDVRCHMNHEKMLGRTLSGTLRLTLTDSELRYECDLADTTAGRDAAIEIGRGDLRGSSFMWHYRDWDYDTETDDKGNIIRTITKVKRLVDVGPVYNPAYEASSVVNKREYMPKEEEKQTPLSVKMKMLELLNF